MKRKMIINTKILTRSLIKLLISILLFYEGWYLQNYIAIPFMLQFLGLCIIGLTMLVLMRSHSKLVFNEVFIYWLVFGIYSLMSGLIISSHTSNILSSIFTYLSFLAVIFCTGEISKITLDYQWYRFAMVFVCFCSALTVLTKGYLYQNGHYFVKTMSEYNNPNNLGLMMGIGIYFLIMPLKKQSILKWIIRIVISFVFIYIILNTGSRSALICGLISIMFSVYFNMKFLTGNKYFKLLKRMLIAIFFVFMVVAAMYFVFKNNIEGTAIARLIDKLNQNSFSGREILYVQAWQCFIEHPVFGIGYNNFSLDYNFGYFTHSTYMELIACTGFIGMILFLFPVTKKLIQAIKNLKINHGNPMTMIIIMLFAGFFGIIYYDLVFLMALYMAITNIGKLEDINV